MSARIHTTAERPRRTYETPLFIHQEYPEHVGRCCAAIRARRKAESAVMLRDGAWARGGEA